MPLEISEPDWKVFRRLHKLALERYCEDVLTELRGITGEKGKTCHERYIKIYEMIRARDKEIARMFDDLRRSTAVLSLTAIKEEGLLEPEELDQFSPQLLETVESFESLRSRR